MLAATQTPLQFFLTPINQFVGTWAQVVMNIFILTSSFACGMAFHNTAARYLYSLAREGLVPGMMGRTHRRWRSPHVASSVMSVVAACWILVFAFTNGTNDPYSQAYLGVYTLFAVLGTGLVLILQAVVSLAIIAWFRKNGGGSVLTVVVAPALSFIVQAVLVYLLVENLSTLAGASPFARAIPWIMLAVVALGILWALVIRSIRPQAYRNIGHMGG